MCCRTHTFVIRENMFFRLTSSRFSDNNSIRVHFSSNLSSKVQNEQHQHNPNTISNLFSDFQYDSQVKTHPSSIACVNALGCTICIVCMRLGSVSAYSRSYAFRLYGILNYLWVLDFGIGSSNERLEKGTCRRRFHEFFMWRDLFIAARILVVMSLFVVWIHWILWILDCE